MIRNWHEGASAEAKGRFGDVNDMRDNLEARENWPVAKMERSSKQL